MAKKPSRGKLLKLPPKRGKVLELKPKKKSAASSSKGARAKSSSLKPSAKVTTLRPAQAASKNGGRPGRPTATLPVMPPPLPKVDADEKLSEAMEELAAARDELSRLGHELTASHRIIEDGRLSSGSTQSNLRAQLDAMRTDLKTALAELEIARADKERVALAAARRIRDLELELSRLRHPAAPSDPHAHVATEVTPSREAAATTAESADRTPTVGSPKVAPPSAQGHLFPDDKDA